MYILLIEGMDFDNIYFSRVSTYISHIILIYLIVIPLYIFNLFFVKTNDNL